MILTKKQLVIIFLLTCISTGIIAQANKNPVHEKGHVYVSFGHGIGNIWKSYLKQTISFPGISYKVSSLGPYSMVAEYAISNKISAGVAAGYTKITGRYSGYGDEFTDRLTIFSLLARANYHVFQNDRWDIYGGGGIGYVRSQYNNTGSNNGRKAPGKFGYSGQGGARYLFNKKIGVGSEIGYVGGSFVQIGAFIRL